MYKWNIYTIQRLYIWFHFVIHGKIMCNKNINEFLVNSILKLKYNQYIYRIAFNSFKIRLTSTRNIKFIHLIQLFFFFMEKKVDSGKCLLIISTLTRTIAIKATVNTGCDSSLRRNIIVFHLLRFLIKMMQSKKRCRAQRISIYYTIHSAQYGFTCSHMNLVKCME